MFENISDDERMNQISKYNDAGFSVSRLHESWLLCKIYIRRGNLLAWKTELDNIWMELFTDVGRQDDYHQLLKQNEKLMGDIAKAKTKSQLFANLMRRHCFLRRIQDLAGKAGVYIDENAEGFE